MQIKMKALRGSRTSNRRARGVTMLETLLVVGVGGVLIAGAFLGYNVVNKDNGTQQLSQNAVQMIGKIKSAYGSGAFTGMTATTIQQMGALPSGWSVSGANIVDNFGNNITLSVGANTYGVQFNGLTQSNCAAFASQVVNAAYAVSVGTTGAVTMTSGVPSGGSAYLAGGGTPNATNLATGCGAGDPTQVTLQLK
jgi:type II secretory pathway pseudopilin PulG